MSVKRRFVLPSLRGVSIMVALLAGVQCHAGTVISEVLYDATGTDNGYVFVELFGEPGTVLDGLLLEGVNGKDGVVYRRVPLAGEIPADGIFLVADDRGDGASLVANADLVAEVDLQNGPDSLVLRNAVTVLDALGYGDFITGVFGGEGRAAVDVPAGRSLARIDPRLDGNDNLADFIMLDTPSPGALEVVTVPLPPALVLFMSGVAGLAGVSSRLRK